MNKISLVVVMLAVAAVIASPVAAFAKPASKDPGSINSIIEKVRRGVVAIAPTDVTEVLVGTGGSIGSGFIVSKQGHFITNVHVLTGASFATVTLWDDTSYRGNLIAVDPGIDIAVGILEGCPPEKIFPVALGDSDLVTAGELALAMGQPGDQSQLNVDPNDPLGNFGLKQSATVRVVAGLDTTLEFPIDLYTYNRQSGYQFGSQYGTNFTYAIRMQTPIAGGNSGGPLFNSKGEVIGINFFGGSWAYGQAHNYAIPINLAKEFFYSVLKGTPDRPVIMHQARPWLGMDICMPSSIKTTEEYVEFIERYRPKDKIVIFGVRNNSPAALAGFRTGDEIIQVNGKTFKSPEDLRIFIMNGEIDQDYIFTIRRGQVVSRISVKSDVKRNYDSEFSV